MTEKMEEEFTQHHISQQFNIELRELRNQVLGMGGLVEEQLNNAIIALTTRDVGLAKRVYTNDYKVNALEVAIDEESTRILAIRQPTARDLRLVMAVIKTIPDLERIGDQAGRIAHMALQIQGETQAKHFVAISHLGNHVRQMLHDALDAFARIDVETALQVIHEDLKVDQEYDNMSRQLLTYMMEDSRTIPIVLNIMWSARALERIAAHSRNICEYLIYFVKGKDVRHVSLEKVEEQALQTRS
jgi:phosphate transport system protein